MGGCEPQEGLIFFVFSIRHKFYVNSYIRTKFDIRVIQLILHMLISEIEPPLLKVGNVTLV